MYNAFKVADCRQRLRRGPSTLPLQPRGQTTAGAERSSSSGGCCLTCGHYLYPYPERRGLFGKRCRNAEAHWIWIKKKPLGARFLSISSASTFSGEESPRIQDALDVDITIARLTRARGLAKSYKEGRAGRSAYTRTDRYAGGSVTRV